MADKLCNSRLHTAKKKVPQAGQSRPITERMRRFGTADEIELLRSVLRDLLEVHFPTLGVEQIVPTSFVRRHYEAEILSSEQERTAWLQVTEQDLRCAVEGDSTAMRDSLARFSRSLGFTK